jgi:hypothetical protein
MQTAAFVTYNNVRDPQTKQPVESGWHDKDERRALVLQSTNSNTFAEACTRLLMGLYTPRVIDATIDTTSQRIDQLWPVLTEVINTLEHVVIYVGVNGTEHAIKMASQLPIEKLVFLMCDCDIPWKRGLLADVGLQNAKTIIIRECGGEHSMGKAYRDFLETGTLPPG